MARTVAGKLQAQLTGEQKKEIDQRPTENLAAYDLYLQGRALVYNGISSQAHDSAQSQLRAGISKLDQAIGLDGQFALAYCALVRAYDELYAIYDRSPELRAAGDQAIEQARRVAPNLAEVHLAYAEHLYYCYRDYERLRPELELAKQGLPNSSEVLSLEGSIARRQGRFEEAVERLTAALQVDPTSLQLIKQLAFLHLALRHWPEAERLWDQVIELAPNDPQRMDDRARFIFAKTGSLAELKSFLGTLRPGGKTTAIIYRTGSALLFWSATGPQPGLRLWRLATPIPLTTLVFWMSRCQKSWFWLRSLGLPGRTWILTSSVACAKHSPSGLRLPPTVPLSSSRWRSSMLCLGTPSKRWQLQKSSSSAAGDQRSDHAGRSAGQPGCGLSLVRTSRSRFPTARPSHRCAVLYCSLLRFLSRRSDLGPVTA